MLDYLLLEMSKHGESEIFLLCRCGSAAAKNGSKAMVRGHLVFAAHKRLHEAVSMKSNELKAPADVSRIWAIKLW